MTREETKKLFAIMTMAYPPNLRIETTEYTITLWSKLLEDIDYKDAERGIINFVKRNKYPPSIADIRAAASGAQFEKLLNSESQLLIESALTDLKMLEDGEQDG